MNYFDLSTLIIIFLTLVLCVAAVTQEVLLEAGDFMVSVKLILMSHKNSLSAKSIEQRVKDIQNSLHNSIAQK